MEEKDRYVVYLHNRFFQGDEKMRPIIGVMPLVDEDKDSLWMLPGYLNGVLEAGGIPVIFPLINDVDIIRQMFSST